MTSDYSFSRHQRIGGRFAFKPILDARVRDVRGPLAIHMKPNDLPYARLGISIGRPVGIAAKRNRIKRLLRESFRLMQHDWPRGYDMVILVRPHVPLALAEYQRILSATMVKLHKRWSEKT